ncbi:hypothetical protein [Dysgonomonas alginatilytica]|nr:hypothetical protein [Dysgonomonas alginatilytica]
MILEKAQNKKQIAFCNWAKSQIREIGLSPVKDFFSENEIKELRKEHKFSYRECFRTAAILALEYPNISYVEGYSFNSGIHFPHAINRIILPDGSEFFFDFQMEIISKHKVEELSFVVLKIFTDDELAEEIELPKKRYAERVLNWYFDIYSTSKK